MLQTACFRSEPSKGSRHGTMPEKASYCNLRKPDSGSSRSSAAATAWQRSGPNKEGEPHQVQVAVVFGLGVSPSSQAAGSVLRQGHAHLAAAPSHQHSASVCAAPAERGHSCSGQGSGSEARRVLWTCWRTPALQRWCGCSRRAPAAVHSWLARAYACRPLRLQTADMAQRNCPPKQPPAQTGVLRARPVLASLAQHCTATSRHAHPAG